MSSQTQPAPAEATMRPTAAKSIVLFSDGTGNSSAKLFKTNVWRMYEAVDLGPPAAGKRFQISYYDDGLGAGLNVPVSIVVGGARILTTPRRAVRDWESYFFQSDACHAPDALDSLYGTEPEGPEVRLTPLGLGLALHVQFAGPR